MILNINLPPLKESTGPTKREIDLHALADMVAEKHFLTGYELKMKKRKARLVAARADFAKTAIKKFTQKEIADYLGISRSSVAHYLKDYQDKPAKNQGSRHGCAKLSNTDISAIRRMYFEDGWTQEKIAYMFDVTSMTISNVINNQTWSHV